MTQQQTVFRPEVVVPQWRRQWGEVLLLQSAPARLRFWSLTVAIALIIVFLLIAQDAFKKTLLGYFAASTCILKILGAQLCVGLRVPPTDGRIERKNWRFPHANTESFHLEEARFAAESAKAATIAEPSDRAKTTLIKFMPALREAANGEGPIGGLPGLITGPRYRDQAAAIELDEPLVFGTISDNICLCNSTPNLDWMTRCVQSTHFDDAIMAMATRPGPASAGCGGVDGQ